MRWSERFVDLQIEIPQTARRRGGPAHLGLAALGMAPGGAIVVGSRKKNWFTCTPPSSRAISQFAVAIVPHSPPLPPTPTTHRLWIPLPFSCIRSLSLSDTAGLDVKTGRSARETRVSLQHAPRAGPGPPARPQRYRAIVHAWPFGTRGVLAQARFRVDTAPRALAWTRRAKAARRESTRACRACPRLPPHCV